MTELGWILDSSLLIESERRGEPVAHLLSRIRSAYGNLDLGVSTISVVELNHGVYRAKDTATHQKRASFLTDLLRDVIAYPLSVEIASLAGQIEGEQGVAGITIGFEDLVIGATALHLGFGVATLNVRHFQLIPGLRVVSF